MSQLNDLIRQGHSVNMVVPPTPPASLPTPPLPTVGRNIDVETEAEGEGEDTFTTETEQD